VASALNVVKKGEELTERNLSSSFGGSDGSDFIFLDPAKQCRVAKAEESRSVCRPDSGADRILERGAHGCYVGT
jgi:hypothetical protein